MAENIREGGDTSAGNKYYDSSHSDVVQCFVLLFILCTTLHKLLTSHVWSETEIRHSVYNG